jgi:hypothetical protein
MLTVHLRITDAATKKPLPVRLRVTDEAGNYYAPLGRLAVFACGPGEDVGGSVRLGKDNFAHIDGSCEIALPAETPLRIRAFHGPEWTPLDQTVTLGPGKMALRFEMTRWCDWKADGWTRTDSRCHFLAPHAALLEAAAEDVDVVNLLACVHRFLARDGNTYPAIPNLTAFSGQTPAVSADGREVFVNTFNTHPSLGKLGLLNCHRVVYPLAFGGAEGPDDWSLCDWADQCHRKDGVVVWCEAFRDGLPGGEALIALILGKVDAIEFDPHPRGRPFLPWVYHLWNAGFLVPLVGGSGKDSNRGVVGAVRTYQVNRGRQPVGCDPTQAADAAGSPFITNGPLVRFAVDGTRITASAESITPFDKLEIVANGQVIASTPATPGPRYSATLGLDHLQPGWVAARAIGGAGSIFYPDQPAFAHTSPVVVGEPSRLPVALAALRTCVEQTREWIETQGQFTNEKRKTQHLERCAKALAKLAEGSA